MSDVTLDGKEYEELWEKAQESDALKAERDRLKVEIAGRSQITLQVQAEYEAEKRRADRYKAALEKIRKISSGRIVIEHIVDEALLPTPCGGPHRRDCYCEHILEHCCAAHCCWCSTKPPGATP